MCNIRNGSLFPCFLVATYLNIVDATETRVTDKGSKDSNEVRSLTSWIHWLGNDANSVAAGQSYDVAPGNQKSQGSSGGTMVYKV